MLLFVELLLLFGQLTIHDKLMSSLNNTEHFGVTQFSKDVYHARRRF